MNNPQYTWSAFHDNQLTKDYETRLADQQAQCHHDYKQWAGNPLVNMCAKCGNWHFKN